MSETITDFEHVLMKMLTHDNNFFSKCFPILEKDYFSCAGNQELFNLLTTHFAEYRNTPTLTELVARVKDVSNSEIRAEIIKELQIVAKTEQVTNTEFMLNQTLTWVKDALYLQALQIGSEGLMKRDDALKLKAQQIMDKRSKVSIDSDLGIQFDDIDTMIEYYSARNIGIKTQHAEFNKRLGAGFLPGTLSVILAAAGIGKSLMMTDLISGMIKNNKNILLVSLEMKDTEIMKRVHANAMDLPINSLCDLAKTEAELKIISESRPIIRREEILTAYQNMKMSGTCGKLCIKDYAAGSFSALMLEQLVETFKLEKGIEFDIIFIDYLGIMKSDLIAPSAGLYSYVKSIGEEVRATAKKLNVALISASQLNRAAVGNTDSDNSTISDSLGTAMTSDLMLFLLQDDAMKEKKEIVCKITKNRFTGRTDTWLMNIDYEHMRFIEAKVQQSENLNIDITDTNLAVPLDGGFEVLTAEKQAGIESFADDEIKNILSDDLKKLETQNPLIQDMDELYKDLGI